MEDIERLIQQFADGTISPLQRQVLYRRMLGDAELRQRYPDAASVIVPLALAANASEGRSELHQRLQRRRRTLTPLPIAASIALLLALGTSIAVYAAADSQPQQYCSNSSMSETDIDQWFNQTMATTVVINE